MPNFYELQAVERIVSRRDPPHEARGAPHGWLPEMSRRVLLVPGWLAGDSSMVLLSRFLSRAGYEPVASGIRRNVGCPEAIVTQLSARLSAATAHRSRLAIVGHSRGGLLARVLASRRPDLVAGIVMLGSPQRGQLAAAATRPAPSSIATPRAGAAALELAARDCTTAQCCESFRQDLAAPLPPSLSAVSLYSRIDEVVDWRNCVDASARNVEVRTSHEGMIARADVFRIVTDALVTFDFGPPREARLMARRPARSHRATQAERLPLNAAAARSTAPTTPVRKESP